MDLTILSAPDECLPCDPECLLIFNYGLEYDLSDIEGVQLCALISTIERRLAPAINWFLWGDDFVYTNFTRKMYFGSIGLIKQLYIPYIWRNKKLNKAKSSQLVICLKNMSDSEIGEYVSFSFDVGLTFQFSYFELLAN
ncbi:unnamed protein product [Schistosoma curassoni]|uniref:Tom37 domain-containing protein n=1 Tax=Schistosoma curassoni TaxID=6186 RepID=A0A183K112_9TREM|nr:unnamed protein product [Schistosoma curassoni]